MNFDIFIKNQPNVVKLFNNTISKNRLVHTYLFEGAKGTGKNLGAYYFASMILCESNLKPCGKCASCINIQNMINSNVFYIEPINGSIRKEQILDLEHEFSMTALAGTKRVFIINGIDKCNTQSANSLLKFLEEAHDNCYGILLTENINSVIPTIISRSQVIHFKKVSSKIIANLLEEDGVNKEVSLILSNITNDPEDAKKMISEGIVLDIIEAVKKIGKSILKQENAYLVYIELIRDILKEHKEYHEVFLNVLSLFIKDALQASNNSVEVIFKNDIEQLKDEISVEYLDNVSLLEIILKYKERLRYNINVELMYCEMFIELGGLNG